MSAHIKLVSGEVVEVHPNDVEPNRFVVTVYYFKEVLGEQFSFRTVIGFLGSYEEAFSLARKLRHHVDDSFPKSVVQFAIFPGPLYGESYEADAVVHLGRFASPSDPDGCDTFLSRFEEYAQQMIDRVMVPRKKMIG